ncbi:HIRAN domain-containing protein [Aurantimonas sp. VKM B-3413]|uniref:HIRAN domain-containing protein n=1 Tax=Aurantimonas sp. VKM B-3413 TaxID=2779401 RepID=UPI001E62107E|nr:HIRAN domain-containing protein [Aurantimonas sp. VKM B-3413]MCB8840194.1 HIRAN domain-containing protein [Aurantimonas sp. VKM B-3413]
MTTLHPDFFGTDLEIEASRLDAGEPDAWCRIAGLQYYGYGRSDGLDGVVMPRVGQRLSLVRRPDNPSDPNAIEIWLGNQHHIGHIPREDAEHLAPILDAGGAVRAYCGNPGNGTAWSATVVLVGTGVGMALAAIETERAAEYSTEDGEVSF